MTKNERDLHVALQLAHDVEELVAGLVEVDRLALAAEHGGGGAEVAAQRAADRGDERGGHVARPVARPRRPCCACRCPRPPPGGGWAGSASSPR